MSAAGGVVVETLRWASASHAFELNSADPAVMARARQVFRPWLAADATHLARSWNVSAEAERGRWVASAADLAEPLVRTSPSRIVTALEYQAVLDLAESPADVLTFHAALVSRAGRGVLILGAPQAGKSTLATALWLRGYAFAGDDTAVVDPETILAHPVARRVSLREPSRVLLGDALWQRVTSAPASEKTSEGVLFHPSDVDGRKPHAISVAACVFLGRAAARTGTTEPRTMSSAAAVLALLPFANLSRRHNTGDVIGRLAPFAGRVHAFDLPRTDLDAMTRTIDRALDAPAG
jgi:hypothetical protein